MKLSLSTNWCNRRVESGEEIADLALALGFDELELGFRTTVEQAEGFRRAAGRIPVGSIHAFCPVPLSAPQGHPELYALASFDDDARAIARHHVLKNIDFAADIGADTVVLHAGRVPFSSFFHRGFDSGTLREAIRDAEGRKDDKKYAKLLAKARKVRGARGAKLLEAFRRELDAVVPALEKRGVVLALENLPYLEGFPDEAEMAKLADSMSGAPVKPWFDTGHHRVRHMHGWTEPDFVPKDPQGLHLNDVKDFDDDHLAPGEGNVDFAALEDVARSARHVVFEPGGHVDADRLAKSVARMRSLWKLPVAMASFALALFAGSPAFAEGPVVPTDLSAIASLPHGADTSGGKTLRVYRDLSYGTRGDAAGEGAGYAPHSWGCHNHRSGTFFDVYADEAVLSSPAARAKMPVFVFLHGGSWSQCYDKDGSSLDMLKRVAAAGYLVVTMDYQLQNDVTEQGATEKRENAAFADMLADVDTMMTYLGAALPAAGLPTNRVVIGGESAGAHLAMCYAWDQDGKRLSGASLRHDLRVAAVMSAVGPSDLADDAMFGAAFAAAAKSPDPAVRAFATRYFTLLDWLTDEDVSGAVARDDMASAAAVMEKWSPLGLVDGASCHAILAYGCTNATASAACASDGIVPVSNFSSLTNALAASGVPHDARLFMLPGGFGHGNISWNYEPSVSWMAERLAAFKSERLDALPPGPLAVVICESQSSELAASVL